MTSMLSTSRMGDSVIRPAPSPGSGEGEAPADSLIVARLGARGPAGVLLGVGLGGFIEQRHDLGRIGCDRVAHLDPFRAVPLLDEGRRVAVVIGAARLDWADEAGEADRLQTRVVDVEVFQAAAHILAGDDLLAGDLLRFGNRLRDQHRVVDAAIVEHLADLILRRLALAGVDYQFLDIGKRWIVRSRAVPIKLLEALRAIAGGSRVRVVWPPDRDELVHRE